MVKANHSPAKIVVCGSINMDLVFRCHQLPTPGETIAAESFQEVCGGKGANQAVAASRAGGSVSMIGCVGDDLFANRLRANLEANQIDCSHLRTVSDCPSGLAMVAVESSGQNSILIVPGANARLTPAMVRESAAVIQAADCLLVQFETPLETVCEAVQIAKEANVRVILDPAPAIAKLPLELMSVDLITPNESEAKTLAGLIPAQSMQTADLLTALHRQGMENVALTMGASGTILSHESGFEPLPSYSIEAVDTTAAGDAFAGALAVFWSETDDLRKSILLANAAGALAASRCGAQPSLPHRQEIESLCRSSR